ncbi:MAG: hypothetical protein DMG06_28705 [Acidobacteria bacterium]|nr:MAG: hypothetical protein DMG06_28705 [Acidobacteriota bacterium]
MTRKIHALTGWPLQACWDRARKLGLSHKRAGFRRWSKEEEDYLLQYAGSKNIHYLARQLKRTEKSVREKLATMRIDSRVGISARVTDGHTKMELAEYLRRSPKTIQRWIDLGWLKGRYEGKHRKDDTLRITDEDFRSFWKKHPWEMPFHMVSKGMQWFFSVMIDIPMNEVRGDPLARQERRKQKKDASREALPEEEVVDEPEFPP